MRAWVRIPFLTNSFYQLPGFLSAITGRVVRRLHYKRGYSSVVEHPAAVRQVLGSTPSVPCFGDVRVSSSTFPSSQRARYQNVCDDGPNRDLNPGPPAPKAGIIPLDHLAVCPCGSRVATLNRFEQGQVSGKNSDRHVEKTLGGREGGTNSARGKTRTRGKNPNGYL